MPRRFQLFSVTSVSAGLLCLTLVFYGAEVTAEESFELRYESGRLSYQLLVYPPPQQPSLGVVLYLPGTGSTLSNAVSLAYRYELVARGYTFIDINYPRLTLISCDKVEEKARAIFDMQQEGSAINALIAANVADPVTPIALIGASQGAWIAHVGTRFLQDANLRAALLLATGTSIVVNSRSFEIPLDCNTFAENQFATVLGITGEEDWYYTTSYLAEPAAAQVSRQLEAVTGVRCGDAQECVSGLGQPGWVIVPSDQTLDGVADHDYQRYKGAAFLDPTWVATDATWGLQWTRDWLLSALRP